MSIKLNAHSLDQKTAARLAQVLTRRLAPRGIALADDSDAYPVTVTLSPVMDSDSFSLTPADGGVQIAAGSLCTLYAGLGYFLLHSTFDWKGGFTPAELPVYHKQTSSLRGMYLASHFYNFWHVAPMEEVIPFLEDIALWGGNTLMLCLAPQHYTSLSTPEAKAMIARLKNLFAAAGEMGLAPALILLSNTGFKDSPAHLSAPWAQQGSYITPNYAELHTEICPSKEGGLEEIDRQHREFFAAFADVDIRYFTYFVYDEGGCTCPDCEPWSTNGVMRVWDRTEPILRECFPDAKIVFSTWHFDRHLKNEGSDFYARLARGEYPSFDYVMAIHGDGQLMNCVIEQGCPADRRIIDFPEISMWGAKPWGGFGANPIPMRLDNFFRAAEGRLDGGFPYSEGFWENINEFLCLTHYSGWYESTEDALRAYLRFHFGLTDTAEMVRGIQLMETTLWRGDDKLENGRRRFPIRLPAAVSTVYRIVTATDETLPEVARRDPRWRILYLRAVIDYDLWQHNYMPSEAPLAREAMAELTNLYHAHDPRIQRAVRPPMNE